MALFADYEPRQHGAAPPAGLATRPATRDDVPALAALRAERDGMPEAAAASVFERMLVDAAGGGAVVLVAAIAAAVAGYGAAARMAPAGLPEGWYLSGVIVAPARRRFGIGTRLTRERLDGIAAREREAFYFVNERNRASIDLHARLGFREIAHDIRVPGVTFTGGVGVLFRVDLERPAPSRAGPSVAGP